MKVHFAAHALKESLSAGQVFACLQEGVRSAGAPEGCCISISDGGDGFLDAWVFAGGAQITPTSVRGPMGKPVDSAFARDSNGNCYIEIARASGLALVPADDRKIWRASTVGTGELLYQVLQDDPQTVYIGLGGSATNDGGIGMLAALADCFGLTGLHRPLTLRDLDEAYKIPLEILKKKLSTVRMLACTDVVSPLLGSTGCSAVFAPQKGASATEIAAMEEALTQWANHVELALGETFRDVPGAGAAGGLGFALAAMGAALEPGASLFIKQTGFREQLFPHDIVLTTEGRFDYSSMAGKAPWVVCTEALTRQARPFILCGSADPSASAEAQACGVTIVPFGDHIATADRLRQSPSALTRASSRLVATQMRRHA